MRSRERCDRYGMCTSNRTIEIFPSVIQNPSRSSFESIKITIEYFKPHELCFGSISAHSTPRLSINYPHIRQRERNPSFLNKRCFISRRWRGEIHRLWPKFRSFGACFLFFRSNKDKIFNDIPVSTKNLIP